MNVALAAHPEQFATWHMALAAHHQTVVPFVFGAVLPLQVHIDAALVVFAPYEPIISWSFWLSSLAVPLLVVCPPPPPPIRRQLFQMVPQLRVIGNDIHMVSQLGDVLQILPTADGLVVLAPVSAL